MLFIVVFLGIYLLGKYFMTRAVEESLRRRDLDETLVGLAVSITVVLTAVVAVALAATTPGFGVVLSAFAILAGALAVGFATRDFIANFVAGVFIVQDGPFTVGDSIAWNGNSGVVREIQLRVTNLDTFDNELITVPNGDPAGAAVVNNVANNQRRVSVPFGIGYDDDIDLTREVIIDEGSHISGVLDEPPPTAPVVELGDSAVGLSDRIWIDPYESSYGAIRAQYMEPVKRRFDAEGIDMPYPNTELSGAVDVPNIGDPTGASGD